MVVLEVTGRRHFPVSVESGSGVQFYLREKASNVPLNAADARQRRRDADVRPLYAMFGVTVIGLIAVVAVVANSRPPPPRLLAPEVAVALVKGLSALRGKQVSVGSIHGDIEARAFADRIVESLDEARATYLRTL